jgi:hypothetical protein
LRTAISGLIANPQFSEELLRLRKELAVATESRVKHFGVNFMYTSSTNNEGKFVHARDSENKVVLDPPITRAVHFNKAYFSPEGFGAEVEEYRKTIQTLRENVKSVAEYSEMKAALDIVSLLRPQMDLLCLLIELIFRVTAEDRRLLQSFLRDYVILENLDLVFSERLLKRFVSRFERAGSRAVARDYEEMILNTVAEFTLLSMGIISPKIFELRRVPQESTQFELADEKLREIGVDLFQVLKQYNIEGRASFIWFNRYATAKVRSTGTTEQIVRTFITKVVREDRKSILSALKYEEFFKDVRDIRQSHRGFDDFAEAACEKLAEVLSGEEFQKALGRLLHTWYPKFYMLL